MRNSKGMLLTLVTLVLVVLIVGELITYTYLSINYESVYSVSTSAKSGLDFIMLAKEGISSFLGSGTYVAAKALALYETSNSQALRINNTAYALKSILESNSIYGNVPDPGIATVPEYVNTLVAQAKSEGLSAGFSNQSLSIYQNSPYNISSTYVALVSVNSSAGQASYPIVQNSSTPISGLPDLHALQEANNYTVSFAQNPAATVYGNEYASSGSVSPYQFALGRILVVSNSLTGCSGIPSSFSNANYILATPNDIQMGGSCGFGGVVTYMPASSYSVPYLVYNSASGIMNSLSNGTLLLLDGKGLALLNVSGMQAAIHSGQYYAAPFAPSYLQWAQGDEQAQSPGGIYSFNLYNRRIPMFSSSKTGTYVTVNVPDNPTSFSISLWFYDSNVVTEQFFISPESSSSPWVSMGIANGAICTDVSGSCVDAKPAVQNNTWYNYIISYNSTTQMLNMYVDGQSWSGGGLAETLSRINSNMYIGIFGLGSPVGYQTNGSIVNVQVYNDSLTQGQVGQLYDEGMEGMPVLKQNLAGWWPLNGNTKDYSGNNDIGISNSVTYTYLRGYTWDPVYDGSEPGQNATSKIAGIMNCPTIQQCSNNSVQHLYLGNPAAEAGYLGLANAVLPGALHFETGMMGYVVAPSTFNRQWSLYIDSSGYFKAATSGTLQGPKALLNTWQFVCAPLGSASYSYMYVDGVQQGTGGTSGGNLVTVCAWVYPESVVPYVGPGSYIAYGGSSIYIGAGYQGTVKDFFNGKIADVQVYNYTVNSVGMQDLYLNDSLPAAFTTQSNALVADWPLDEPYNGLLNMTLNSANALNPGTIYSGSGIPCTNENMSYGACGVAYSQP